MSATNSTSADNPADDGIDIDMLVHELGGEAASAGFDVIAHTTVAAYNARLGPTGEPFRLPDYPSWRTPPAGASRAVVLIGNSRAVWPHFMEQLQAQPSRRSDPHPFDRWTSEFISRLTVEVVGPHYGFDVRFVFEGGARAFSALHLAEACGLAYRGPAGLAVHPRMGPWFALRAAIVIDTPGVVAGSPDPVCERCVAKPCIAALQTALGERPPVDVHHGVIRDRWHDWLAVRDACPVGVEERYGEAQIRWHYAHDRGALE